MRQSNFEGEYWNVDAKTSSITRLQFTNRTGHSSVSAWGSCFPKDCEWGETELHVLDKHDDSDAESHAFATWHADCEPSHCLMTIVDGLLTVIEIAIRSEFPSYRMIETFRKDAARSSDARNPDPLEKFSHMWDGSEPGWKLIQYANQVFLVEFNFDESGPTRFEFPAVVEFVGPCQGETEVEMWERLRGCSGIGLAMPLGPTKMNRLRTLQRESNLELSVITVEPDDYLALGPNGKHHGWTAFPNFRRPVIERMLETGVPIVSGRLE